MGLLDFWKAKGKCPDKHHCSIRLAEPSFYPILCPGAIPLSTLGPFSAESIVTQPFPLNFPTVHWIWSWIRHFCCLQPQSICRFESLPAWDKWLFLAPISVSNGPRSVHFLPIFDQSFGFQWSIGSATNGAVHPRPALKQPF